MSTPTATGNQQTLGRTGYRTWTARWTAADVSDYVGEKILDVADLSTTTYEKPRYKVTKIEWNSSATVGASVYFDSFGDNADVLEIGDGAMAGEYSFVQGFPSGSIPDPDGDNPGNLVIDTINAAAGDTISFTIEYRVGGKNVA